MLHYNATAFALFMLLSCNALQPAGQQSGQVEHIVICWLKTPGDSVARQRLIDESKAFEGTIPGLLRVSAGTTLPSTRPTVDTSFDVAIVMTFEDEAALRAYEVHPAHQAAVERALKPLVQRLVIYDFKQ